MLFWNFQFICKFSSCIWYSCFCRVWIIHKVTLLPTLLHFTDTLQKQGARGSEVGSGIALQAGRLRVRFPIKAFGIFHWLNPSGRTMALGSTQPLAETSTRDLPWRVKTAGAKGWQPYHLHVPTVRKSWTPQTPAALRVHLGLYRDN